MNKRRTLLIIAVGVVSLVAASCSASNDLELSTDGPGTTAENSGPTPTVEVSNTVLDIGALEVSANIEGLDQPTPTTPTTLTTPTDSTKQTSKPTISEQNPKVTERAAVTTGSSAPTRTAGTVQSGYSSVGFKQSAKRDIYIDPVNGDDNNSGAATSKARKSLATALRNAKPGDNIKLMNGRYSETMGSEQYVVLRSGTANNWIRITAAEGHKPTVVGTRYKAIAVRSNYIEVSGLNFIGEGFSAAKPEGIGMGVNGSHHVAFVNNSVSNFPFAGISAVESDDVSLIGNRVFNNAFFHEKQGSGISVWHSKNHGTAGVTRIVGNYVYGNENKVASWKYPGQATDGNGIIVDQANETGYTGSFMITNNVIFGNGGHAVTVWDTNNVDLAFNTAYRNSQSGKTGSGPKIKDASELWIGKAKNVRVHNNLVWADASTPAYLGQIDASGTPTAQIVSSGNVIVTKERFPLIGSGDYVTAQAPGVVNANLSPGSISMAPTAGSVLLTKSVTAGPTSSHDFLGKPRSGKRHVGAYQR